MSRRVRSSNSGQIAPNFAVSSASLFTLQHNMDAPPDATFIYLRYLRIEYLADPNNRFSLLRLILELTFPRVHLLALFQSCSERSPFRPSIRSEIFRFELDQSINLPAPVKKI